MSIGPCVLCSKEMNERNQELHVLGWGAGNRKVATHLKCFLAQPKCRACKRPLYVDHRLNELLGYAIGQKTFISHPKNPKIKYHINCVSSYEAENGTYNYYHRSWKMMDHLGNEFVPEKHGMATYKTKNKTRAVSLKTMLRLKKAGVIRSASMVQVPDAWESGKIDYIGRLSGTETVPPKFFDSSGGKHLVPAPDPRGFEYVGCELEVEHGILFKSKLLKKSQLERIHASVNDGSISGVEVLTAPSAGPQLIKTLDTVTGALRDMGWEGTPACGAHAHVNFKNSESPDHVKRMLMLSHKLEPFIEDRIRPGRVNAHYCESLRKSVGMEEILRTPSDEIDAIIYGTDNRDEIEARKEDKYDDSRYSGVNLHSIYFRGTVEFRYLEGTTDPKKLASFALLYAGMVEQVNASVMDWLGFWEKAKYSDPESIVQDLMRGPSVSLLRRHSPNFIR